MTLPAGLELQSHGEGSVGVEGGPARGSAALDFSLDSLRYQDMRWCVNCGGQILFVPVDRFPGGWRGYCLGCEEVGYVMDTRANSEAA